MGVSVANLEQTVPNKGEVQESISPQIVVVNPLSVARQSSADILERVGDLVQADSSRSNTEKAKHTRRILEYLHDGLQYAEVIAQANDIAQGVVSILQAILEQELNRRQNNEQITIVYYTLSSTVLTIRHIKEHHINEQIRNELKNKYEKVYDLVNDFGNDVVVSIFVVSQKASAYYTTYKRMFVRFLKAGELKPKLEAFIQNCRTYQEDILYLLQIHIASTVESTGEAVADLSKNMDTALKILNQLGAADTRKELEAQRFLIDRNMDSQSIIQDEKTLVEFAAIFSEQVTKETKDILHKDIEDILQESMNNFSSKIEQVKKDININVQSSQAEILAKLNAGPHNLIEDTEFRKLWFDHGWKASIKSRIFVDEICSSLRNEFEKYSILNGHTRDDNWTLPILSQVMVHPAISDAIDEDGSGYISVHEINVFLKQKPAGWTLSTWLLFWAIGWQGTILNSSERIDKIIGRLFTVCQEAKFKSDNIKLKSKIDKYVLSLELISKLTSWYSITGFQSNFILDVIQVQVYDKLMPLALEYEKLHKKLAKQLLNQGGILLEISDTMPLKKQFGNRIESWLLPFLENILAQQLDAVAEKHLLDNGHDQDNNGQDGYIIGQIQLWDEPTVVQVEDKTSDKSVTFERWVDMDWTLEILLYEFHLRMQSLLQGWKRQKVDHQIMVNSFSSGVFSGWHTACLNKSDQEFQHGIKLLENIYNDSETETKDDDGAQDKNAALQSTVDVLSVSVANLNDSMDELKGMIAGQKELLLNANHRTNSSFVPQSNDQISAPEPYASFSPWSRPTSFPTVQQPAGYNPPQQQSTGYFPSQQQPAAYPLQQQPAAYPSQQQPAAYPPQQQYTGFPLQQQPPYFPPQQSAAYFPQHQPYGYPPQHQPTYPTFPPQQQPAPYFPPQQPYGYPPQHQPTYPTIPSQQLPAPYFPQQQPAAYTSQPQPPAYFPQQYTSYSMQQPSGYPHQYSTAYPSQQQQATAYPPPPPQFTVYYPPPPQPQFNTYPPPQPQFTTYPPPQPQPTAYPQTQPPPQQSTVYPPPQPQSTPYLPAQQQSTAYPPPSQPQSAAYPPLQQSTAYPPFQQQSASYPPPSQPQPAAYPPQPHSAPYPPQFMGSPFQTPVIPQI
ncbi:hypothetical protein F5876DRAFT_67021 [Lentinula aff. lateritia]|uniref:Uncharacterized protein n=1 Tax=Lentinula aff. lateritia TaxID=2804960 RepID=A0ACC1TVH5_9AGAR|nr:hypothetical protein F5876DRAFT_67021 [Lentinula aff. lateritia]